MTVEEIPQNILWQVIYVLSSYQDETVCENENRDLTNYISDMNFIISNLIQWCIFCDQNMCLIKHNVQATVKTMSGLCPEIV